MENVVVERSTGGGYDGFHRRTAGGGRRSLPESTPALLARSAYSSFPYSSAPPFPYTTYCNVYNSHPLPPLPSHRHHPALLSRPAAPATMSKHGTFLYRPRPLPPPAGAATMSPRLAVPAAPRKMGEYKSKKPRTPRSTEEPPRAQRRKPLQRAAPLPAATAVTEALDDLEREVTRGFVEDLLHALAPPPSSLPLPTFSLIRAAAAKAAASCAV